MSKALGKRCVWGLCGVLAAVLMVASMAQAEVSTDVGGSILVYPKVIWDGTRDTVIQMVNTSNITVHAHCTYINGAPTNPNQPIGQRNPALCQLTDFDVWLTKQQPTHWVVSLGRRVDPNDGFAQDGSGLDPGAIPPVPPGFTGELVCVQEDTAGTPWPGNALQGNAVLRRVDGDVTKYNAIAIGATGNISDDNKIQLNNTPTSDDGATDPFGNQFEASSCPATLYLNHFADGAADPVSEAANACVDGNCPIRTDLTLVPCSIDFENVLPGRVTVQFDVTNEMEQHFSASTTVDCWMNAALGDIGSANGYCTGTNPAQALCQNDDDCAPTNGFCEKHGAFSAALLGTLGAFTRIIPVDLDGGVIGMAEESHRNSANNTAVAAWDLQAAGEFSNGLFFPSTIYDATLATPGGPVVDTIVIPQQH